MTTPAAKALWYVEAHLDQPFTLDDAAAIVGVSRYHLTRAFAAATGQPVVRYLRGRRLSVAAPERGGACAGRRRAGHPGAGT